MFKMFEFDLQLFGGKGGGSTTVTSETKYEMSPEEREAKALANEVARTFMPAATTLGNKLSADLAQQDFTAMINDAKNKISKGQSLLEASANGELSSAFKQNMTDSIKSGVDSTVGSAINNLANRGVINSSVSDKAFNDISANVANTVANNYSSALGQQAGYAGNLINTSNAGFGPYQNLLNMGQGGSGIMNGSASLYTGTGATSGTQTTTQSGASFLDTLGSGLLGLGTSWMTGRLIK